MNIDNDNCTMSSSKKHDFTKTELCKWCGEKNKVKTKNQFKILITAYNAGNWLEKSVNSVLNQTYKNFEILIIDDCSTDNSSEILKKLNVNYIINDKREGKMSNIVKGYKTLSKNSEDILVELDGDDWLADDEVLFYLNDIYQNPDIWLTYGQFKDLAGRVPVNYSKKLDRTDNYRANYKPGTWQTSALRTFKNKIWNRVKDEDLRDTKGNYYQWTNDIFRMFPMIEMCGTGRIHCCDKVLYIYNNLSPINESKINPRLQLETAKELITKPAYQELPKEVIASIIIPSYQRANLLKWVLPKIAQQKCKYSFEVIVLNDGIKDETEALCKTFENKLNIRYVFTGQRNKDVMHWRIPGFAINIGTKMATGKVLIILDSEIFLLDNCLDDMISPILKDEKTITISEGKWDGRNEFLKHLETLGETKIEEIYSSLRHPLRTELPFFMGISKQVFISLGGYDEDFIGHSFDDSDITYRLLVNGGQFEKIQARVVHLYHPTNEQKIIKDPIVGKGFEYNKDLLETRKKILVRNVGKSWGDINSPKFLEDGWNLKAIPKIAHFYWGNTELPYLRFLTVYSFYKFNPDWKIKVYYAKKYFKENTWTTFENKYQFKGGDFWYQLKDLNIELIEFDMETIGVSNSISEVFKSEYLKNYLSTTYGGLWSDMDILYFESMNKLSVNIPENANTTNVISIHENYGHSVGFTLSSPKNEYHDYFLQQAKETFNKENYQGIGPTMVTRHVPTMSSIENKFKRTAAVNMSTDTVYAYDFYNLSKIYNSNDMSRYTKNSIGLHWYGGWREAEKYINELTPFNYNQYDNVLCKTISLIYENKEEKRIQLKQNKTDFTKKVSLIIPCFQRAHLLDLGLWSISKQNIPYSMEIIVVNDGLHDDTENVCKKYSNLNIRYLFTGKRNSITKMLWRVPGFAFNVGIKKAEGEIIVLSNPEMFHLNNCIEEITKSVLTNKNLIGIPKEVFMDKEGKILQSLVQQKTLDLSKQLLISEPKKEHLIYIRELPYLMAINKKVLLDIGGYDEDFIGYAGDDDDLVGRLKDLGLKYYCSEAEVIHLYHGTSGKTNKKEDSSWVYNQKLLDNRKGIIQRNLGKNWGCYE